jgi:hypothetical protein
MKKVVAISTLALLAFFFAGCYHPEMDRCVVCHWEVNPPSGPDTLIIYDHVYCGSADDVADFLWYEDFTATEYNKQAYRSVSLVCNGQPSAAIP